MRFGYFFFLSAIWQKYIEIHQTAHLKYTNNTPNQYGGYIYIRSINLPSRTVYIC